MGFVEQEMHLLPAQLVALQLRVPYNPLTAAAEAKGTAHPALPSAPNDPCTLLGPSAHHSGCAALMPGVEVMLDARLYCTKCLSCMCSLRCSLTACGGQGCAKTACRMWSSLWTRSACAFNAQARVPPAHHLLPPVYSLLPFLSLAGSVVPACYVTSAY